ncbi:MAG TPA: AarF/UbiB family protein [Gemmatimonadaceae bacterium]|nr:AarF/UbiB family protein [Gemmatimonadaceae bacterium]
MLLAPRYLPRLTALVRLFTRHGLRDLARQQGLHALAPDEFEGTEEAGDYRERAAALRRELVALGPAYVKLGQLMSTRPDLLPEPYIEELAELQDDVAPIPFSDVREVIESELGTRLSKLFECVDEEPLGSASLGQVHAATLRDGRAVVIKVQRPGIRASLADDMDFFREAARFLEAHTGAGQRLDLAGIVRQLEQALIEELDYRIEARNAQSLRLTLAEFPHLIVPRVIEAYSTASVLTTERVLGVKVRELPQVTRLEHDFGRLAEELARAYLKQIAIAGHFHADPHPGNIFVVLPGRPNPRTPAEHAARDRRDARRREATPLMRLEGDARDAAAAPAEPDEPKLALIDFGMTAHLSDAMRERVVQLLLDLSENRGSEVAETLVDLGDARAGFDRSAFERDIASLVARNHDRAVGEMQAGRVLFELLGAAYEHGIKLPGELTLLAKTLFNLDGVTRALDPEFVPADAINSYLVQIATKRAREEMAPARLFRLASQTTALMSALPHRLDRITERLADNDFTLRIDSPEMPVLLRSLQKIANRILAGLVLAGLLIASAMLLPYQEVLGLTGFVLAAGFGFYLVITILFKDRESRM